MKRARGRERPFGLVLLTYIRSLVTPCLCDCVPVLVNAFSLQRFALLCCSASVVVVPRIAPLVSSQFARSTKKGKRKKQQQKEEQQRRNNFQFVAKINGIGENYYTIIIEVPPTWCPTEPVRPNWGAMPRKCCNGKN